jgi:hypothetical protein
LFGTLFNDIYINREDGDGNVVNSQKIPLSYSPREKMLARIEGIDEDQDPLQQPFAIILPRMGFEITGFEYDSSRKLTSINKFVRQTTDNNSNVQKYQYNPVPYNITFDLSIFVKNTSDGTMILEQILPYFTPEWTTTVQLVSDPNITLDVPLILNSVSQDDVYEGSFEERRSLIWTLSFTMKGYFFGPTKRQGVINLANTTFFDVNDFETIDAAVGVADGDTRVTVTPGLDANDNPTSDANNSVDRDQISSTDNFGFITQTEEL